MKLSIIIPYYNADEFIGGMLDSLLEQDLEAGEYEIIVVDDGSKEEPVTLKRYVAEHPQIVYVREENAGPSAARNRGLEMARGDWIYFCDADDQVQRHTFRQIIEIGERLDLDIADCERVYVQGGEPFPEHPRRDFDDVSEPQTGWEYFSGPYSPQDYGIWHFFCRRSFWLENSLRFENIIYVEDRLMLLEVMSCARRMSHIGVEIYFYVQRGASVLHQAKKNKFNQYIPGVFLLEEKVTDLLQAHQDEPAVKQELLHWQGVNAYMLLHNVFRYSDVATTKDCIDRLKALGAYPIPLSWGNTQSRTISRLMNCRPLWMAACRLFHLLPYRLRLRF